MKSSIQDVAQLAHVSISTVSRSFTRPDLVSKATRDKVMKAADELNFSISRSAAALKTGRALRIAVLVSGRLNLWFSSSIIEGLNQIFHDEGYDISIYQMSSIEERREFFDMLPVRRNVDAVIVISFDIDANEIEQLKSVSVPIIGINSSLPEERGFSAAVRIDDKQGSELAARHLMTLGHRDIAYIRTDREVTLHFSVQGRFESFMACCQANGVEPRVLVTNESKNNISKVVTQLLSLDHTPTAIASPGRRHRGAAAVPAGTQRIHRAERYFHHRLRRQHLRARPRPDHRAPDACRNGAGGGPHDARSH